jgi:hypothetical protein
MRLSGWKSRRKSYSQLQSQTGSFEETQKSTYMMTLASVLCITCHLPPIEIDSTLLAVTARRRRDDPFSLYLFLLLPFSLLA